MFGLEEPYLCIKVIFVGFNSILWLVLGLGWKFWVKKGKPAEIASGYRYESSVPVLKVVFTLEDIEYRY